MARGDGADAATHAPDLLDVRRLHLELPRVLWSRIAARAGVAPRPHSAGGGGLRLHRRLLGSTARAAVHLDRPQRRAARTSLRGGRDRPRHPVHQPHRNLRCGAGEPSPGSMNAFAPSDPRLVWIGGALLLLTLALGFAISRLAHPHLARTAAWSLVALAFVGAERLTAGEPAVFRMLGLLCALLYGMKAVVSLEERLASGTKLSPLRWFAFAAAWPGMRPSLFASLGNRPLPGGWRLIRSGLVRLVIG